MAMEAEFDEQNGWERYNPDTPSAPEAAAPVNELEPKRRRSRPPAEVVPSPQAAQDALTAMNQMIDSWNTERLAVFCTEDQVFNWPTDTITRTLGPTGNFVGNRPILIDDATYFRDP